MCVLLQEQSGRSWENWHWWPGYQLLESVTGVWGIPVPVTGMGAGLSPSATGGNGVCPKKQFLGVRDMSSM